ncbi:hexose phosphate transport protein [Rodentibacter pneumotropicus]|uniref:Hexose phosphate transport protein n=1 Tax=Rodentibacter pneumotropicus TaxID=758 RepID=A0A3S4UB41_9PAST|nr:hexose phosphate transport protein [Rodentibacter pneumotropicus]
MREIILFGVYLMLNFLNEVRKPTLDLPIEERRKMWFKPFMQSYLVVFSVIWACIWCVKILISPKMI